VPGAQRARGSGVETVRTVAPGGPRAAAPLLDHGILQPGERHDEQRGEEDAEQRVDPDERDVECA
jgi:hypothetical protein